MWNLLYICKQMSRFKFILGLFLLVLSFFIGTSQVAETDSSASQEYSMHDCSRPHAYASFQSPDVQCPHVYAELGGCFNPITLTPSLRVQRSQLAHSLSLLKSVIHHLAMRLVGLAKSCMALCDFSLFYRYLPVNQYYVFTLKRILI